MSGLLAPLKSGMIAAQCGAVFVLLFPLKSGMIAVQCVAVSGLLFPLKSGVIGFALGDRGQRARLWSGNDYQFVPTVQGFS